MRTPDKEIKNRLEVIIEYLAEVKIISKIWLITYPSPPLRFAEISKNCRTKILSRSKTII